MTPPMVRVTWLDSGMHIDHGWAPRSQYIEGVLLDRMHVTTVGMLMAEDEDTVLLGLNYDPAHDAWIGAQVISKGSIISREELNVA